jgi:hypothetical protein
LKQDKNRFKKLIGLEEILELSGSGSEFSDPNSIESDEVSEQYVIT